MSGQLLVFSESIDDVLKVVQETPRGRWFVEAFAERLKGEGTSTILSAIAKLENHISSISNSGASDELLQKARSSIALARQEIANLEPKSATLSSEAQMFANLAEMSRKAFGEGQGGKGIERALKLVADLDHDLNSSQKIVDAVAAAKPAQQYFKADEAIFEPAPAPKLVVEPTPATKPAELVETPSRGAKLVIRRMAATENASPIVVEEQMEAKAVEASIPVINEQEIEAPIAEPLVIISTPEPVAKEPAQKANPENSRIVIIRRKADEILAVPLVDIEAAVNAA